MISGRKELVNNQSTFACFTILVTNYYFLIAKVHKKSQTTKEIVWESIYELKIIMLS